MFDVPQALGELDRWKDILEEDDRGHRLVYRTFLELGVVSRIAEGDTSGLIGELIALLQHRGLTEREATMAMDDVFYGIGPEWGDKWGELLSSHRSRVGN